MFGRLGWAEILIIVVLVLILFGHNKIPSMMKNVADGLKVFKKEMKSDNKADAAADKPVKAAKTTKTTARTAKKKTSAALVGAYVEFGAYASATAAQNAGRKLVANNADLFDGVEFVILNDAAAGGRTSFKLRAAYPSVAAAKKFVSAATKYGVKCRIVEL